MKALTLTSLVMALVLASPGEAKDSTDISPGTPLVAPVPRPDRARLKRNDSGGDVPILQRALNNHGERLTVDGIFGRQTEKAVKDFQAQSGLESTGVVDSGTWSALAAKPAPASDPALDLAKRDAEAAKAQAMELAKQVDSLNSELGTANAQRNELRIKLDLATSKSDSTQSQLKDKQASLEEMQSELETAKQDAEQANAKATEFAKLVASLNSELEAKVQASEFPTKLGQNTSEAKSQSQLKDKPKGTRSELETAQQDAEQAKAKFATLFASVADNQSYLEGCKSELGTAEQDAEQAKAQAAEFARLVSILNSEPQTSDRGQGSAKAFGPNEQPPTIYVDTTSAAIAIAQIKVGNILMARGDLAQALESYRGGSGCCQPLGSGRPEKRRVAAQDHANFDQTGRRPNGSRQFRRGAEVIPGRSVCRRPFGQFRPRECRLAAPSLRCIQQNRRCTGGGRQSRRGAKDFSRQPCHS